MAVGEHAHVAACHGNDPEATFIGRYAYRSGKARRSEWNTINSSGAAAEGLIENGSASGRWHHHESREHEAREKFQQLLVETGETRLEAQMNPFNG
ncbi:MAG: hypothetical protein KDB57_03745 [Solirubrobacterales bacterium]|nr:hypothetical protein [Solirubrobacterales bacterium]